MFSLSPYISDERHHSKAGVELRIRAGKWAGTIGPRRHVSASDYRVNAFAWIHLVHKTVFSEIRQLVCGKKHQLGVDQNFVKKTNADGKWLTVRQFAHVFVLGKWISRIHALARLLHLVLVARSKATLERALRRPLLSQNISSQSFLPRQSFLFSGYDKNKIYM